MHPGRSGTRKHSVVIRSAYGRWLTPQVRKRHGGGAPRSVSQIPVARSLRPPLQRARRCAVEQTAPGPLPLRPAHRSDQSGAGSGRCLGPEPSPARDGHRPRGCRFPGTGSLRVLPRRSSVLLGRVRTAPQDLPRARRNLRPAHAQTHAAVLPHVLAYNAPAVSELAGRLAAALRYSPDDAGEHTDRAGLDELPAGHRPDRASAARSNIRTTNTV